MYVCIYERFTHLPRGHYSLHDAHVNDDPGCSHTPRDLPVKLSWILDAGRDLKSVAVPEVLRGPRQLTLRHQGRVIVLHHPDGMRTVPPRQRGLETLGNRKDVRKEEG